MSFNQNNTFGFGGSGAAASGDFIATDIPNVQAMAGVIRGNASGGSGSTISWSFLTTGGHNKLYFTSVAGVSTGAIRVSYPTVSKIISFNVTPDETLASLGLVCGAGVDFSSADIFCYLPNTQAGFLRGNSTTYLLNNLSGWDITYNSVSGLISINPPLVTTYPYYTNELNGLSVSYVGTNNYRMQRVLSGLGSYNSGYQVVDIATNTVVTGNPTTADIINIMGSTKMSLISGFQVAGNLQQSKVWTASSNLWISALVEV